MRLLTVLRAGVLGLLLLAALTPTPLAVGDRLPGALVHHLAVDLHGGVQRPAGAAASVQSTDRADAVVQSVATAPEALGSADDVVESVDSIEGVPSDAPEVGVGPPVPPSQSANVALPPTRVVIPALEVAAPIVAVGLTPWGAMATPERVDQVGWFELGAVPGVDGTAILAGHRDSPAGPAIFFGLERLVAGDQIQVFRRAGAAALTFQVQRVEVYPYDQAPLDAIFGADAAHGLILITCVGDFSYEAGYAERVVVYANLALPATALPAT